MTARKTSTVPTRVYSYGAPLRLTDDQEHVISDQLFRANRYYNKRVEIERARRDVYRKIRASLSRKLARLEAHYDRAHTRYLEARGHLDNVPKKERDTSPQAQHVRDLKVECNALWTRVTEERRAVENRHFAPGDAEFDRQKELRIDERKAAGLGVGPHVIARINKEVRAELRTLRALKVWNRKDAADEDAEQAARTARKESGCFCGVYLAVDTAVMQAFRTAKFQPSFRKFEHEGRVGAQIHNVTVEQALYDRQHIHIEKRPEIKLRGRQRSQQPREAAVAHLCLGGVGEGAVVLDIPFVLHRPLPADAIIKWVYLVVRRIGLRTVREIQFTIESQAFHTRPAPGAGLLAVNVGWRVLDSGDIRVATTWDGAKEAAVILPAQMREVVAQAEELLGYADNHFNTARNELKCWLKTSAGRDLAERLAKIDHAPPIRSVAQWRAHGKLARTAKLMVGFYSSSDQVRELWHRWRVERLAAKADLFDTFEVVSDWLRKHGAHGRAVMALYLEWWRRKDTHLLNWARGSQRRLVLARRELYRRQARQWADTYKTVVIEKWDKRRTAEVPEPEDDMRTPQEENASAIRQLVGVSRLVDAVKHAFGAARVDTQPATDISREHHECGGRASTVESLMARCTKCGRNYDQDVNAACALWQRSRKGSGDARKPGGARRGAKSRNRTRMSAENLYTAAE